MQETDSRNDGKIPVVCIGDVQKASRGSFSTTLLTATACLTSFQALMLITIASLSRGTGREFGGFDVKEIMIKMEAIANASGDFQYSPTPSFGESLEILNRLGEVGVP